MGDFVQQEWIDEVRAKNDMVEVASSYLPLKSVGKGFYALCPFHNEKTPSFHIHSEKQIYYCFGCGKGGNVISFIMAMEGMGFTEAVKFLAQRAGIQLPDTVNLEKFNDEKRRREQICKVNLEAAKYYRSMLLSPAGGMAMDYLTSRGLDAKTIKTFGIGYAPAGWETLKTAMKELGFEEQLLIEAGLLVENRGKKYDRFRDRVIFPIIDPTGMVIGFGGRAMDDSLPKYLNSPESLAFSKGKTLFGLNMLTGRRPLDNIVLVEGYMDVIALHQFGFNTVVASLGTSLTREQAAILKRYAKQVYIAYDGDAAGQKAALRGLDALEGSGCSVKVLNLPGGMDPDEALRKHGAGFINEQIANSLSLVEYKLLQLKKDYSFDTQDGRLAYAKQAAKLIATVANLIERDGYIEKVGEISGFRPALIRQEVERLQSGDKNKQKSVKRNLLANKGFNKEINARPTVGRSIGLVAGHIKAERYLVGLMVQNDSLARNIIGKLDGHIFEEDINQQLVTIVAELVSTEREVSPAQVLTHVRDQDNVGHMVEIFGMEMEYDNIDRFISDCVSELSRHEENKHRRGRQEELMQMDREGSPDPAMYNLLLHDIDASIRRIKMKGQGKEGNI